MTSRRTFLASSAALLSATLFPRAAAAAATRPSTWPYPPAAARIPTKIGRFGHSRIDDYAWLKPQDPRAVLRDPASLEAPIRAQIEAENAYTDAMLEPGLPLRRRLKARIEQLAALKPPEEAAAEALPEGIEAVPGQFAHTPDRRHLFWVKRGGQGEPARVVHRDLASGADETIHEESDPAFTLRLRATAAGGYIAIRGANDDSAEVRLVPSNEPGAAPALVEARTPGLIYDVDEWNGALLLLTNADGAEDFTLLASMTDAPGRAHLRTLVPHRPGRPIVAVHPFAAALVREEWRDGLPRLVLMRADGEEREIAFGEAAYQVQVPPGQDFHASFLRLVFQSPRTPPTPYRLDLSTGALSPENAPETTPGFAREDFEVRRLHASAEDGETVPITVLMRKGQALDGSAPLYLHGYGSYGLSLDADFDPAALALVEQGWIVALAHVRGGGERGRRWWRSVLKQGKKTTFSDFIACAEHLIAHGYGAKGRIVAHGLSAGGLLMGAVFTQRPELWAGVIAPVAFVDVLTTLEYYEEHPLGDSGLPVWGDPRIAAEHDYVASYSPYDRLRPAAYPALLVTGSVDDDAVWFWEPLKFAIKARHLTTAGNPILSLTGFHGGHMGPLGARPTPEQQAMYLAFAIWAAEKRWGEVPQRSEDEDSR